MTYRTGIGYDIHRLVKGRDLILGGVKIPYEKGLLGHSDADVLIHSISDAMLGALGRPDIGMLFPDTAIEYKGMSSDAILKKAVSFVKRAGFKINNLDSILILEEPKISKYKDRIIKSLSSIIGCDKRRINVKAKTQERLGEIGKKRAIACFAVVSLIKEA
jgi:2-C-methyl-D-erythritol 2,4-cyclodiphosphate synthase